VKGEPDFVVERDPVSRVHVARWERIEIVEGGGTSPLTVSGTKSVEADAAHDDREPPSHVVDLVEVLVDKPGEGFLYGVLGITDAAEHAKCDVEQVAVVVTPGASQSSVELQLVGIAHAAPPPMTTNDRAQV
jgi:hypothetical protein